MDQLTINSGTSGARESRISKRGNGEVRKRLHGATLSAVQLTSSVGAIHRRVKEEGKSDNVARAASGRTQLVIIGFRAPETGAASPWVSKPGE